MPANPNRLSAAVLLACLTALAPAQGLRLVDCIEAPMLYVSLEASPAAGIAASGEQATGGSSPVRPAPGPVHQLLADPALDTLFGASDGAAVASGSLSSGARALMLVRGVLGRSSGDVELALLGVVPSGGQPLLVLRARLLQEDTKRLQGVLDGPELAQPHRVIGGNKTWSLRSSDGSDPQSAKAGELVEMSIVGNDLLVANDTTAMEELLAPQNHTSASNTKLVLSADPRFTSLAKRLQASPGSLLVYGDWLRLGQRLQAASASSDASKALPSFLLEWSGLGSARSVMASLSGVGGNFTGTLLMDFDRSSRDGEGRPMPPRPDRGGRPDRRDGARPPGPERAGPEHFGPEPSPIDGWLAAAQSVSAKTLLPELPGGGLGGLVLAVDLADIARHSHRAHGLLHLLHDSYENCGLDFDRNVFGRLGARGTVQLLFRRGSDSDTEVVSVYSLRAKNKKAAADIFQDLRRVADQGGFGKLLTNKDRKGPDVLQLTSRDESGPICVAVYDESVLVAFDDETLVRVHDEFKRAAQKRSKRDVVVTTAVQSIGGDNVAGLFDLDLAPLFERIATALESATNRETSARIDLSRIPKRHIGYLELQPRDGGVVLQVRVLSSQ